MISTVTVSTVSTVTTAGLAGPIAIIGIILLFGMLLQKEVITTVASNPKLQRLSKILDIGIAPLLIAFAMIVISQVINFLR